MIPPSSSGKTSAASVVARLRNIARERGLSVESVRDHFAREAFFRRLQASPWANDFILKGSVLLLAWFGEFHRPTIDADFLVRRPMNAATLREALASIVSIPMDDHVVFDASSIHLEEMQEDRVMAGMRVSIAAMLGVGGLVLRADIGFSDVVTPGPRSVELQGLMTGTITLLGSTPATVIAEKYDAMVDRGVINTRMKDYFDLATMARRQVISGSDLVMAIRATFSNRNRTMPHGWDHRLDELPADARQQQLWGGFLRGIDQPGFGDLVTTLAAIRSLLEAPLAHVEPARSFHATWQPGRGWG